MANYSSNSTPPPLRVGMKRGAHPVMVVEKPKNAAGTAKRLLIYISGSRKLFFQLIMITVIITVLTLYAPALQKSAIDALIINSENQEVDFAQLGVMTALLIGVYIIISVFTYLQGIFSARLSQTTVKNLRNDLFNKLVRLPVKYIDTHSHGDLMSRMTNDVENISNSISQSLNSFISGVIIILGSIVIMLIFSPVLTLLCLSTIIITVFTSGFLSKRMRKFFKEQQHFLGSLNGHTEEMITGFHTVTAFDLKNTSQKKFNEISKSLKNSGIKAHIFSGAVWPLMGIISNFGFILVAVFGGLFALEGVISIGTIQAFILYTKQFSRSVNEIANQYAQIQTAIAGAERVFEVMDTPSETDNVTCNLTAENIRGNISFKNVDFSYTEGRPVLKNFNLDIKQGEKIAVVGATGSGKTTMVNLLTRFYDIDAGIISLDGTDIRNINRYELRKSIAMVLQDTFLFSGSIEDNITYGKPDATLDEMENAAVFANADRFINNYPDDYRTILAENGEDLSAGQRQLLAIARAVLSDPKILILDEATSSVDTRTEAELQTAMVKLMKNRTSIIIAHRLSTIRDADRIVVLNNGSIAESGNHEELLSLKGVYYSLYQKQFEGQKT